MKIKVILPVIVNVFDEKVKEEFTSYAAPGTEVAVVHLDKGPASIECEYDDAIAVPDIVEKAKQAQAEGFDAVISDCFANPGVKAAREVVDIPVIGAGEAAMLFATGLGLRFSVITILPNVIAQIEHNAETLGVKDKLASIRSVDIPVLDLEEDEQRLKEVLIDALKNAAKEDGAHVAVLGCTGMMGVAQSCQAALYAEGYRIPVVDPAFASLKFAESLVAMGLKYSGITYMKPPQKERRLW